MTTTIETGWAETDRVSGGERLARPPRRRDRWTGQFQRADGGEYDWWYLLPESEREYLRRSHCSATGGLRPDEMAAVGGYDDIETWAADYVAAALLCRRADAAHQDADTAPVTVAVSELVGPVEVAEICQVKVATVYQWVTRGVLPAPLAIVSGTRLWARADVETWAMDTGRLVGSDDVEDF